MKPPEHIPFPPYAYVPGRNARHDEAVFEVFHRSVVPGAGLDELQNSLAWRVSWPFIQNGFYWEAHEVLEPIWMALEDGPDRQFVQGIIQAANAALKLRMDRPKAARRLCDIADGHLEAGHDALLARYPRVAEVREFVVTVRAEANLIEGD